VRWRSKLARPNICRFSILILLTVPSTRPELCCRVTPACTAASSRRRLQAKDAIGVRVSCFDGDDPLSEFFAAQLGHHGGEPSDVGGEPVELGVCLPGSGSDAERARDGRWSSNSMPTRHGWPASPSTCLGGSSPEFISSRAQRVRDNLRVKEVRLGHDPDRRWIVCHNPGEAERDAARRSEQLEAITTELR
jgi:hypothetical protein